MFPLESSFWLKTEPCLVSASLWLLTGQHYVTDKLSSCERIDKQPALTSRPWISLTSLIWASPPHKLDLNVDPSLAHISVFTHICASSRRMRWPKRDVFHAALSVFSDDRVAFSHVCAMNMIARTEGRRKASDGRPLNLNFGPLSCLNSHFCLQGENFSLSPFICIKEKNTFQYYLVFSQVSVHASLSVSMCVAYFAYYGHLKKKNSSCHPVEIPYVCYCLCSMEVRTWEIQLDLWKQLAFLMCVSSRYCVCVKMYTMWWILQFLWFGQPKPRTLRGRNAAQSDYLTVFMHHECVHYEKKKQNCTLGLQSKLCTFF